MPDVKVFEGLVGKRYYGRTNYPMGSKKDGRIMTVTALYPPAAAAQLGGTYAFDNTMVDISCSDGTSWTTYAKWVLVELERQHRAGWLRLLNG